MCAFQAIVFKSKAPKRIRSDFLSIDIDIREYQNEW